MACFRGGNHAAKHRAELTDLSVSRGSLARVDSGDGGDATHHLRYVRRNVVPGESEIERDWDSGGPGSIAFGCRRAGHGTKRQAGRDGRANWRWICGDCDETAIGLEFERAIPRVGWVCAFD